MYGRLTVTVQLSRGLPGLSPQAVQFSGQTDRERERYTAAFIEVAPQLKNTNLNLGTLKTRGRGGGLLII